MGNQKATKAQCMLMICSIAKDNCWCCLIRKHDNTKTYSVTIVNGAFKKLGAEHGGANPYYIGDKQYVVASILVKHSVTIGTNKGTGGKREENQKPVKFYYLTAKTEYSAKDIITDAIRKKTKTNEKENRIASNFIVLMCSAVWEEYELENRQKILMKNKNECYYVYVDCCVNHS